MLKVLSSVLVLSLVSVCQADILVIGDSVSLGWMPNAQAESDFNLVHAFNGFTSNNQGTRSSLVANPGDDLLRIERYLLQRESWDAIIFNAGIHDMRSEPAFETTVEEYGNNLNQIYDYLDTANTPIFWATTTPIPEAHPNLDFSDHPLYRSAALSVASTRADSVIDLYDIIVNDFSDYQVAPDNLHLNAAGNQLLGSVVADRISSVPEPSSVIALLALAIGFGFRRTKG